VFVTGVPQINVDVYNMSPQTVFLIFQYLTLVLLYTDGMAWTPPIDRRGNKALLNKERFFTLLCEQNNFMDQDTVSQFYMGVVKVVARELREHKIARLPELGDLALVPQRPRLGWMGKTRVYMGPRDVLRFYPLEKMRIYYNKRQNAT